MEDRSFRRMPTLVTRKARRGLSANEAACALISMMARSTCSNQRPDTLMQDASARLTKPLATHGRTTHIRVKIGKAWWEQMSSAWPQERTCAAMASSGPRRLCRVSEGGWV